MREWDFAPVAFERERTFNLHSKIEDHANDVHDYLKYLKFGYGRATDDASMEIRHGRMSREDGIAMVQRYDAREPSSLAFYCDFLGLGVGDFYGMIEPQRDPAIWRQTGNRDWAALDDVSRHPLAEREERARVTPAASSTFAPENRRLYYNRELPPMPTGDPALDVPSREFLAL